MTIADIFHIVSLSSRSTSKYQCGQAGAEEARDFADDIVETLRDPLLIFDPDLRAKRPNAVFYKMFQVIRNDTEDRSLYDLGDRQWDAPSCANCWKRFFPPDSR